MSMENARDEPGLGDRDHDQNQIEQVQELMEAERAVEKMLELNPEMSDIEDTDVRTVATNTTRL